MTRCVEFYEYWRDHPNFCGKSRQSVYQIDSFIKLLDSLKERGINESDAYAAITENAARPLFAVKKKATYDGAVDAIADHIKRGKRPISAEDIKIWLEIVERRSDSRSNDGPAEDIPRPDVDIQHQEAEVKKVIAKCAPAAAAADGPGPAPVTSPEKSPIQRQEAYLKKLYFQALACPTCIEVRNHKCKMKKECPVCGAKLVSVVMRVDRITEQVTP